MESIEILPNEDYSSDSFPSAEYSMLHEVEESPYRNGVSGHTNFDLTSVQSAKNEIPFDGNSEVNSQISKLISNNLSMKEALNKTNSMMKEQLSNLPSLIDSKMLQQKQNLQKAEEIIVSLRKENAILQNKYDSLFNASQSKDKDICMKFNGSIQTDEETGYEIVLQEAKLNGLVNGHSHVGSETQQHLKSLEDCLKTKDEELITLKKEKDQLSETVKAYGRKIEALEKELNSELESMKKKLITESSVSESYKKRCESLQQQLNNYQEKMDSAKMSEDQIIQDLNQEKCNLQQILKMEQQDNQNVKDELKKTIIKLEQLQVDYQRVSQLLEIGERDGKAKIEELRVMSERKDRENQEIVDHLTAQLYEAKDLYCESKNFNDELNLKLDELQNEAETIAILKQQIEVYKKDYEISEMQKKSVQYEMEKIADELKSLKENPESISQEASPSSERRKISLTACKKFDPYKVECECPLCGAVFSDERAAQNHVNRCLKKSRND